MNALDFVKAFGVALLLMVLNVTASFGVVAVYAYLIEPGHEAAYYETAAQSIAPWSSVFAARCCSSWRRGSLAYASPHGPRSSSR